MKFQYRVFPALLLALSAAAHAGEFGQGVGAGVEGVGAVAVVGGAIGVETANRQFERERAVLRNQEKGVLRDMVSSYNAKQSALDAELKRLRNADVSTPAKAADVELKRINILRQQELLDITLHHTPEYRAGYVELTKVRAELDRRSMNAGRMINGHAGVMLGGAAAMVAGGAIYLHYRDEKIESPQAAPEPAAEEPKQESISAELGD